MDFEDKNFTTPNNIFGKGNIDDIFSLPNDGKQIYFNINNQVYQKDLTEINNAFAKTVLKH